MTSSIRLETATMRFRFQLNRSQLNSIIKLIVSASSNSINFVRFTSALFPIFSLINSINFELGSHSPRQHTHKTIQRVIHRNTYSRTQRKTQFFLLVFSFHSPHSFTPLHFDLIRRTVRNSIMMIIIERARIIISF